MPYSVEGFGKIESDEYDIGIGSKEMGYSVEDIYDGSSSGACWPVRKLVGERQGYRYFLLHQSTKCHSNRTTGGTVIMSYPFSKWRLQRWSFTSGFGSGDGAALSRSMLISKPNLAGIT